jgi:hypothetical protein
MGLGEELDLADPAAAALEVESGTGLARAAMRLADAGGQAADFLDRHEVEAAAPHERAQCGEELLARGDVAAGRTGADERGALPRQRRAFVVRQRRVERDRQRRDFGGRAQPQVDAEHVAFAGLRRQRFDQRAGVALRRLARLVAPAPRQTRGIVEQDRIDVRAVVELVRAELAERDRGEARGLGVGHAADQDLGDRRVERAVAERAQLGHHEVERKRAGQIADGERRRQGQAFAAQARRPPRHRPASWRRPARLRRCRVRAARPAPAGATAPAPGTANAPAPARSRLANRQP